MMKNLLINLPVVTKEMVSNDTIEQIVKGACLTLDAQRKAIDVKAKNADVLVLANHIAVDFLESIEEYFEALLHYYIYRSEQVVMPFSIQHRFMFECSSCLSILEGNTKLDSIMDEVFNLLGEYIELIFRVAYLLDVANHQPQLEDVDYHEEEKDEDIIDAMLVREENDSLDSLMD